MSLGQGQNGNSNIELPNQCYKGMLGLVCGFLIIKGTFAYRFTDAKPRARDMYEKRHRFRWKVTKGFITYSLASLVGSCCITVTEGLWSAQAS